MPSDKPADSQDYRLWYLRRDGETHGPYPAGVVANHILLGRIRSTDELSTDQLSWRPLAELPELIPEVMRNVCTPQDEARLLQARLRADERCEPPGIVEPDAYSGPERRRPEPDEFLRHRAAMQRVHEAVLAHGRRSLGPLIAVLLVALVVVGIFTLYRPELAQVSVVDCAAPPAPGVNWNYCQLAGAQLAGADLRDAELNSAKLVGADLSGARLGGGQLSYADLTGARLAGSDLRAASLTGAILVRADLSRAQLTDADLGFVNLQGARLDGADLRGARLDRAIWVDGRLCAPGSVGRCD